MTILDTHEAAQVCEALEVSIYAHYEADIVCQCGRCNQLRAALALLREVEVPQDAVELAKDIFTISPGRWIEPSVKKAAALIAARDDALVERCVEAIWKLEGWHNKAASLRAAKEAI